MNINGSNNFPVQGSIHLLNVMERDLRVCRGSSNKLAFIVNYLERITSPAAFTPLDAQSLVCRFRKQVQNEEVVNKIRHLCIEKLKGLHHCGRSLDLLRRLLDPKDKEAMAFFLLDVMDEQEIELMAIQFNKLGLAAIPFAPRLDLIQSLLSGMSLQILSIQFGDFGFIQDFQDCASWEQFVALAQRLLNFLGERTERALIYNFEALNVLRFFPDPEKRFDVLMRADLWMVKGLVSMGDYRDLLEGFSVLQRLDMAHKMIELGENAAIMVAKNFKDFALTAQYSSVKRDLILKVVQSGKKAAEKLSKFEDGLDLSSLEFSDKITLLKEVISKAGLSYEICKYLGFDREFQKCATFEERLAFAKMVVGLEPWGMDLISLIIEESGFIRDLQTAADYEERLYRAQILCDQFFLAPEFLQRNLGCSGFLHDIAESSSFAERLQRAHRFAALSEDTETALQDKFQELGFASDLNTSHSISEGCLDLISHGQWAAVGFFSIITALKLPEKTRLDQRVIIASAIAEQGEDSAEKLAKKFLLLFPEKLPSVEDRIALANRVISQGGLAKDALDFIKWGFLEDFNNCSSSEKIELAFRYAAEGDWWARAVAEHLFIGLRLNSLEMMSLAKLIAKQGRRGSSALIKIIKNRRFESSPQLYELHKLLYLSGCPMSDFYNFFEKTNGRAIVRQLRLENLEHNDADDSLLDLFLSKARITPEEMQLTRARCAGLEKKISAMASFDGRPQVKRLLQRWLDYTQAAFFDFNEDVREVLLSSNLLLNIADHKHPDDRYVLVRYLSFLNTQEIDWVNQSKKAWGQLCSILLACLQREGLSRQDADEMRQSIEKIRAFKTIKQLHTLLQVFLEVLMYTPLTVEEMEVFSMRLKDLLKRSKIPAAAAELMGELQGLRTVNALFGRKALFDCLKGNGKKDEVNRFFKEKFQRFFPVTGVDSFAVRYQETFGSFRNPSALFTYLGTVNQLPPKEKESVKAALTRYVQAVMDGSFPKMRYEISPKKKHLAQCAGFDNGALMKKWQKADAKRVISIDKGAAITEMPIDFIRKKIAEKHLDITRYPILQKYLSGKDPKIIEEGNDDVLFQNAVILFCLGKVTTTDFVEKVGKLHLNLGEFHNDLNALKKESLKGTYTISESDHADDLLMIGTEIQGSCQRVDGESRFNKCLPSYLLNGEIRAIVIKDKSGKLVARSLLRLMWDGKNNTLLLLQERIYSNSQEASIERYLECFALEKAKKMGLPLVSNEIGKGPSYPGTVKYLGGDIPFIYSDACGGIKNGQEEFEAIGCHTLYCPNSL